MNPPTVVSSLDLPALRKQYVEEGYFILPGVIPRDHLELLRRVSTQAIADMDAEMDRKNTTVLGINHKGKRYFVGQSYRAHPELGAFLFSDLMADIVRATLGDTGYLHNDQYVVKCEKEGMKFSWHQDGAYVAARIGDHPECITCWCSLDEVSEANGTIYILPVPRFGTRALVPHEKDPQTNDRVGYFGRDPGDPVICPAGSIAVFSSTVFHRSGANPSGAQRRAYLAQYAPVPLQNKPGEFPQYFAEPFLVGGKRVR
jgi:ectoine hydroxylase-related dioxygenase (phytanoyl-CoA dioxygenase family)